MRLLDEPRPRPEPLELARLRRQPGEDDYGDVAGRGRHHVAPGSAAQPEIDHRSRNALPAEDVETVLGRFGGDDRKPVELEEPDQRTTDRKVVFENQHST